MICSGERMVRGAEQGDWFDASSTDQLAGCWAAVQLITGAWFDRGQRFPERAFREICGASRWWVTDLAERSGLYSEDRVPELGEVRPRREPGVAAHGRRYVRVGKLHDFFERRGTRLQRRYHPCLALAAVVYVLLDLRSGVLDLRPVPGQDARRVQVTDPF